MECPCSGARKQVGKEPPFLPPPVASAGQRRKLNMRVYVPRLLACVAIVTPPLFWPTPVFSRPSILITLAPV